MENKLNYLKRQYKIENIKQDYYCSKQSNIPFCCFLFFIIIWPILIVLDDNIYRTVAIYKRQFEYIPCLFCLLKNKPNNIIQCDETQKQKCGICD